MQFQYQYTPSDLKAIRDAQQRVHYSPGSTITVWAIGLAVCLLILAAIGSWSVLSSFGTFAAIFIAFYVYVLTRKNVSNRETLVRTLTLGDKGVSESYRNSEFHRTWTSFQRIYEANDHFLFQHYETVLAIPKRVVAIDQLDTLRGLIDRKSGSDDTPRELPEYHQWFADNSDFPIYRFSWTDQDVQNVYTARMHEFDKSKSMPIQEKKTSNQWGLLAALLSTVILLSFLLFYLNGEFDRLPPAKVWLKIIFVPVAIGCPFLLGYIWWKFTVKKAREMPLKIPRDEISVRLTDSRLLIGYPEAVSQYGWRDIKSFVHNQHFIGFRPQNGLIHVIANRAFGGCEAALEFLRKADELRERICSDSRAIANASSVETGNPYQSPPEHN